MSNPKEYNVGFKLGQVVDLLAELKKNYTAAGYSIDSVLNDSVEESAERMWSVNDAERGLEGRARLADLISTITGEPFGDPAEAAKVAKAVQAVRDYKAAQDALVTEEV